MRNHITQRFTEGLGLFVKKQVRFLPLSVPVVVLQEVVFFPVVSSLGLEVFNPVFSVFIRVAVSEKPKEHNLPIPSAQSVFQTVIFM